MTKDTMEITTMWYPNPNSNPCVTCKYTVKNYNDNTIKRYYVGKNNYDII